MLPQRATVGRVALALACATVTLPGCASLPAPTPDARPLAESSVRVYAGFIATRAQVTRELDGFETSIECPLGGQAHTLTASDCFARVWEPRIAAVRAIADYSDQLAAILGGSAAPARRARGIIGAAHSLLSKLELPGVPRSVSTAIGAIYDALEADRATDSAAAAMAAVEPHVRELLQLLLADLADAEQLLSALRAKLTLELVLAHNDEFALRASLERRRRELSAILDTDSASTADLVAEIDAIQRTLARLPTRASLRPRRLDAALAVLGAARDALSAWSAAHADLAAALAQGRRPSMPTLLPLAEQLENTIDRVRIAP